MRNADVAATRAAGGGVEANTYGLGDRGTNRSHGLETRKALAEPFVRQDQHGHDIDTSDSPRLNREERGKLCIKRIKRF